MKRCSSVARASFFGALLIAASGSRVAGTEAVRGGQVTGWAGLKATVSKDGKLVIEAQKGSVIPISPGAPPPSPGPGPIQNPEKCYVDPCPDEPGGAAPQTNKGSKAEWRIQAGPSSIRAQTWDVTVTGPKSGEMKVLQDGDRVKVEDVNHGPVKQWRFAVRMVEGMGGVIPITPPGSSGCWVDCAGNPSNGK